MKNLIVLLLIVLFTFSCKKDNSTSKVRTLRVPENVSTIQDAINKANNHDTVLVSKGTYEENINFNGKGVYLTSVYYRTLDTLDIKNTVIKGKSGSVVTFENKEDSTSVIDGLMITYGSPQYGSGTLQTHLQGGGIYCDSGSVKGINLKIRNNVCGGINGGGAINAENSKLYMQNCKVYGTVH